MKLEWNGYGWKGFGPKQAQNGNGLLAIWISESLDEKSELELIVKIKVLNQDSKALLGEHKPKTNHGIF